VPETERENSLPSNRWSCDDDDEMRRRMRIIMVIALGDVMITVGGTVEVPGQVCGGDSGRESPSLQPLVL
jgi:hypothetical protein